MTYDEDHWREVIKTVIDRIGVEKFLELLEEVLIDTHLESLLARVEQQGEG